MALPFIVIGILLTVQRLRDAGLPVALAMFFFVPLVNILLFLVLSVLPPRRETPPPIPQDADDSGPIVLARSSNRDFGYDYRDSPAWRRLRDAHRRITLDTTVGSAVLALAVVVPATLVDRGPFDDCAAKLRLGPVRRDAVLHGPGGGGAVRPGPAAGLRRLHVGLLAGDHRAPGWA